MSRAPVTAPPPHPHASALTAAVAAFLIAAAAVVLPAAPARADTVTVGNRSQLLAAFASPCGGATEADPRVIVVQNSFGFTMDSVAYVSCHVRLDLNGYTLSSGTIALRDSTSMHLMSSRPNGRLITIADYHQDANHPGIRTSSAKLTIDGVYVSATGADQGAGIGGGGVVGYGVKTGESGGTITIINGAQVYASSHNRGAGIGGGSARAGGRGTGASGDDGVGRGGPGANLLISGEGTYVEAWSSLGAGIGGGNGDGINSSASGGRGGLGGSVTITDGARVKASSYRGAGIGGGTGTGYGTTYGGRGGTVVIENATVDAVSARAAAIGGGDSSDVGAHGGSLEVRAGAVVRAFADGFGGGFGTGRFGANNDSEDMSLVVHEGGSLEVWSTNASALILGRGTARIDGTLTVNSTRLSVTGGSFEVSPTGRLVGATAVLDGVGRIVNDGVIVAKTVTVVVSRNNFLLRFHRSGGGTEDLRIYAPSVVAAGAALPALASGRGWNSAADGSGAWLARNAAIVPEFMSDSAWLTNTGATPVQLWEASAPDDRYVLMLEAPESVTARVAFPITATLWDPIEGAAVSASISYRYGGSPLYPWRGEFEVTRAGDGELTASAVYAGRLYEASRPLRVEPGPTTRAVLTPGQVLAEVGDTVTFTVTTSDTWGNPTAVPAELYLESDAPGDEVDGLEVTFAAAGLRSVYARLPDRGLTSTWVHVFEVATRYDVRLSVDGTVTAGEPFEVRAALLDRMKDDAEVADHPAATITMSRTATRGVDGQWTVTQAGALTIAAKIEYRGHSFTTETEILVVPGEPTVLQLSPATSVIHRHDDVTFTISGWDAHGNPVDTGDAELRDLTAGTPGTTERTLGFHEFGDVTVQATLGGLTANATIAVRPDPDTTVLELVDGPGSSVAGDDIPLRVVVRDTATTETDAVDPTAVIWTSTSGSLLDSDDETGFETRAGTHTQTAATTFWGLELESSRTWTVSPAAVSTLTVTPARVDTLDGRTRDFAVTGEDAYGNAASTSGARFTSSNGADRVSGSSVTFRGPGTRFITVSLGAAVAVAEVRVAALPTDPAPVTPAAGPTSAPETATPTVDPTAPPATADGGSTSGPGDADAAGDDADERESADVATMWWIWALVALATAGLIAAGVARRRRSGSL